VDVAGPFKFESKPYEFAAVSVKLRETLRKLATAAKSKLDRAR